MDHPVAEHLVVTSMVRSPTTQQLQKYTEFVNASAYAHFRQSTMWQQSNANDHFFIVSELKGSIVALSLVRERRMPIFGIFKYFIERGPVVGRAENVSIHLKGLRECLRHRALWIRISPYVHDEQRTDYKDQIEEQGFEIIPPSQYSHTVVVELDNSIDNLKEGLASHLKRQLKKAEKENINIRRAKKQDDISQFINAYNNFSAQRDLQQISSDLSPLLFDNIFKDEKRGGVWFAERNNKILAGAAVVVSGKRAVFEWGYSCLDKKTQNLPASHCLHWSIINWAKEQGLTYYDLGGYNADQGEEYGLNRFKLGFSKRRQRVLPEYVYVQRPFLNSILSLLKKLLKH